MQTEFTQEQQQLREIVSRFLLDKSPTSEVRRVMATTQGYDVDVWGQLCTQVGLAGMHIPEAFGGAGFGSIELGIVAEEMGRHLYCGPFFSSSVMAAYALLNSATLAHQQKLLPGIARGTSIATLVLDSLNTPSQIGSSLTVNNGLLTGIASLVIDAHVADLLIVVAQSELGLGLYYLQQQPEKEVCGLTIQSLETLDVTRKISKLSFNQVAVERIGAVSDQSLNQTWDCINVALAHEMMGGAQQLLETTIEYTKIRYQFGRPIGSFQSLKHRCADLLMEIEIAKAATHYAARCLDSGEGEAYAASMAKALAADTYMKAAKEAIQLRGGIGFTWEDDSQLWYKRAKSSEVLMGTPHLHRERMISLMEAAL